MTLPLTLPPCRLVVLGEGAPDRALAATLQSLIDDTGLQQMIEVFAARPSSSSSWRTLADSPRLRWHAPAAALPDALARLPAGRGDLACLSAGIRLPVGGLQTLQAALHAEPRIGSVSPLCAADPLYAPTEPGRARPIDADALDAWLRAHGPAAPIELPAPMRGCTVLRAEALEWLVDQDTGSRWAAALPRAGWLHTACARVLADGEAQTGLTGAPADPDSSLLAARPVWVKAHPLTGVRWQVAQALSHLPVRPRGAASGATPGAAPATYAPVRLHVAHSWGGGLSTWVDDFCAADEAVRSPGADAASVNLVLRSIGVIGAYGQRLALYASGDPVKPLRIWELGLPIHASAIAHLQYRAVLREIAADFGVTSVIVSSLIGHSLDVLRTGLPTVLVAHDHYPFCVAIFASHGGECRHCDRARLEDCLTRNPGHRFFQGVEADDWLALRAAFCEAVLDNRVAIAAPSPSVAARWQALMPALAAADIRVVPHGVALAPAQHFEPPADGPLRLIQIGRLSMEKGGELLEAILPALGEFAHLTLLGCGDEAARLGRLPGVTAIPSFTRDTLPSLIAQARPHLGLVLSVVPETFSYTLSEMWHSGVPVLACRIGSLADRIRDGDNGFLVGMDSAAILARIRELDHDRGALARMADRVRAEPTRTREQMVADYRALLPPARVRWLRQAERQPADAGISQSDPQRPPTEPAFAREGSALSQTGPLSTGAPASGRIALGPISIDPQVTYRQAARAFLRYTRDKAANSPRLPRLVRRMVWRLLGGR
jgi:glycosyltransferase involved in cell wall biosynthesis